MVLYLSEVFAPGPYAIIATTDQSGLGSVDFFSAESFNVPVGTCIWQEPDLSGVFAALQSLQDDINDFNCSGAGTMIDFEGYTTGEAGLLLLFIAMFLWGGYSRQLMLMFLGLVGSVLVSIQTPDMDTKWVILLALIFSFIIAIRNGWKQNRVEREEEEKVV